MVESSGRMRVEKVYDHSPVFLQNLMVSAKGWQIHKIRYFPLPTGKHPDG